jgi:hypothetical protein
MKAGKIHYNSFVGRIYASRLAPFVAFILLLDTAISSCTDFETGIGRISGAYFEAETGRLVLLGDGTIGVPTPSLPMIATAMQWVFPETSQMPYVSIDPIPENPEGPYMRIDLDDVTRGTEFGWVMFEADRLLKCLGLGFDNNFGLPETSSVPGHRNMFDLSEEVERDGSLDKPVWSRFWFYPLANAIQTDQNAMRINQCRIGVKTEVMTLENGLLISTDGEQDPAAKAFADHFTSHYQEYGEEFPVFTQLEQLARLILVAEWLRDMREEAHPISLAWVRSVGGPRFDMPQYTPSLRAFRESTQADSAGTTTTRMEFFGGVDMSVKAQRTPPNSEFAKWKQSVEENLKKPEPTAPGNQPTRNHYLELTGPRDATLERPISPMVGARVDDGFYKLGTRPVIDERRLAEHPAFGTLALPYLPSYAPEGINNRTQQVGVADRPSSLMDVRAYELNGPDGRRIGVFDHHRIDQNLDGIVIENRRATDSAWYLAPERDQPGVIWAVAENKPRWAFDATSGYPVAEYQNQKLYHYRYNSSGLIDRVETNTADGQPVEILSFARDRMDGPVVSIKTSDDQRLSFRSEARSNSPEQAFLFTGRNEVGESKSLQYDPLTRRVSSVDGSDLAESGLQSVEKHLPQFIGKLSEGSQVLQISDGDGYAIVHSGTTSHTLPTRKSELERNAAKSTSLSVQELAASSFAKLFPEAAADATVFVVDASASLRNNLATSATKLNPGQTIVATRDPINADRKLSKLKAARIRGPQDINLAILSETLPGQTGAIAELQGAAEAAAAGTFSNTNAPVKVIVGHMAGDAIDLVHQACRNSNEGLVVGLFCNTSKRATESQRLADEMTDSGAGAVVIPQGLLDAKDAARIIERMKVGVERDNLNPMEWFKGILKELGLEGSFGPLTGKVESPETWPPQPTAV